MKSEMQGWWYDRKTRSYIMLFFFVFLLYHVLIKEVIGDSVTYFSHILDDQNLWEYILMRYKTWSSRVFIELPLPYVSMHVNIWKSINMGMCMLLVLGLIYLSHGKNSGLVVGLLMLYPFREMASAGWIATCVNYLWPLALITVSCIGLDKAYHERKMNFIEIVAYLFCEIFATSLEQACGLYICVLGYTFIMCIINKKYKGLGFVSIQGLIAAAHFIFIMTCPGNYVRKASNMSAFMKDFGTMSMVDKVVLGLNSTMQVLVNESLIFGVFCVAIFIYAYLGGGGKDKSKNDKWICIVSGIPVIFVALRTVLKPIASIYFPFIDWMFDDVKRVTAGNYIFFSFYVQTIMFVIIIIAIILSLINLVDEVAKGVELAFIFITGLLTRVVMGFSPSLYASDKRTFLFLDIALIFTILRIYEYKTADVEESIKVQAFMQYGVMILAVYSVINNIIGVVV